jgi:hypothetical protein
MPVILATCQAEIRRKIVQDQNRQVISKTTEIYVSEILRIAVLGQPRQNFHLNGIKLGVVASACHTSCSGKHKIV